jgi:HD superfamily phosphohydrolase
MGAGTWPKLLHDAVHHLIPFENNPCDQLLLKLINTREFQRLRRIKQLGFSENVFPCANHSRFAHCIGVAHVARGFVERISLVTGKSVPPETKTVVLAGALLHDLGHGPFSHAFEKITRDKHEKRTRDIVLDDSTEIHSVLKAHDQKLPESVADFWERDPGVNDPDVPAYLTHVVSSQMDADRFDYLLRDSHATGVEYGEFDYRWLLTHIGVDVAKCRLYLSKKALLAAEAYVFARYHMYRTVYYHKTTRAAEVMFKLLLKRFSFLAKGMSATEASELVPDAPKAFVKAFVGPMSLQEYLALDDHSVTEFCKAASTSTDQILKDLALGLLNRKYFKAYDVTGANTEKIARFQDCVVERLEKRGVEREWNFHIDSPGDTPYKAYDPDDDEPSTQIYVEDMNGTPREISRLSEPVAQLTKTYSLFRFYFPESLRDEIMTACSSAKKE